MKKLTAILLAAIMLLSVPAFADVIDWVLYTDIRTYIDGVEISSFNIHNNTAVVVEDLAHYGFKVVWDGEARTLSVTRDPSKEVSGSKTSSASVPSGGKIGDRAMEVYSTDIVTYLDGELTESYNVGGMTIVYVDDLAELYASDYVWDGDARTLSMTLSGSVSALKPAPKPEPKPEQQSDAPRFTVKDGVYSSEWAGISFKVIGETDTDSEGFGDSAFEIEDFFMMSDEEKELIVTAFTVVPDEDIQFMFDAFGEEETAAIMAAAMISAGSEDDASKISTVDIGANTWWSMDSSESVGVPSKVLFRVIDGNMFFIMAMSTDIAEVDGFISSIGAYTAD